MDHTPISYLALEPGAAVFSADGERVGTVKHVLADREEDIFDGLVIDTELGPGGLHFVDAPEVGVIHADHVHINVNAADVSTLPKPTKNPAVMENHGVEDSESALRAKLHRAWDLISGNY